MIIKNVKIYTEEKTFRSGSIEITDGRILAVKYDDSDNHMPAGMPALSLPVIDGNGCYALPGMIDMHFHGCMGRDICDLPDDGAGSGAGDRHNVYSGHSDCEDDICKIWQEIADYQESIGVMAMAPAVMTLPAGQLKRILHNAALFAKFQEESQKESCKDNGQIKGSRLVGINMEGPFISPKGCGAQDPKYILPCEETLAQQFLEASEGLVKVLGIAPDAEGAVSLIKQMKDKVRVSIAHTGADYEQTKQAIDAGACHVTHLFNAMASWHHRRPGTVGAVMDVAAEGKEIMAELICDGIHVHPSMIRTAFRLLGSDHIVLISDSMRAAGMGDGEYTLGGQTVHVQGKKAVLTKDGTLAGSVTSLPDCVRTVVREAKIPLEQAVACATINPAKCLGIDQGYGSIKEGKWGDVVLWDNELCQRLVIHRGRVIGGTG